MRSALSTLLVFAFLVPSIASAALELPEPEGFVNDFADILSPETELAITALVEEIQASQSAEIAVVTVEDFQGYDANSFAVELGRAWGVGTSERDDGVVFVTSVGDRETYIATGYGIEGYITDAQAFWITDRVVVPFFREGDFDGGILAGVQEIKKAIVDLEPLPEGSTSSGGGDGFTWMFALFFLLSFVFPWLAAVFARSKAWWPGGVVGGGVGIALASWLQATLWIALPLALFGLFFDYLASSNFKKGKSTWYTGGGKSGWGGGSSSGGWGSSSGGSSSGGFSGGSFGGGGGGSSW